MAAPGEWVSVNSSHISAAAYDDQTGQLSVRFKNGATYNYAGVPVEVAQALVNADSPGRFFNENIRGAYEES